MTAPSVAIAIDGSDVRRPVQDIPALREALLAAAEKRDRAKRGREQCFARGSRPGDGGGAVTRLFAVPVLAVARAPFHSLIQPLSGMYVPSPLAGRLRLLTSPTSVS